MIEPLDLKKYYGQHGKVQAIFSILLGLAGYDDFGKKVGYTEVQRTSAFMRDKGLGDELFPTCIALLIHLMSEAGMTDDAAHEYWTIMVQRAAEGRFAATPKPTDEFMKTY